MLGLCFTIAVAVLLGWASSLLFGAGLAFWPAVSVALLVLVVFVLVATR